jgi:hypothetical protein
MSEGRENGRIGMFALVIAVALIALGWVFWSYGGAAFIVLGVVIALVGLVLVTGRRGVGR